LFDEDSVIEFCILDDENSYLVRAIIDNDCIDYSFVNSAIVRRICKALNISSVKLNKSRKMKSYDERMSESISHVIYSRMIMRNYVESSTFLLITKHEISYHEHSDDISFLFHHCKHLKASKRFFSILSIQIKEMMQEIRQEKNDFKLIRILKRDENIEIYLLVNQSNQEIKNSHDVVILLKKKKRKRKRNKMIIERLFRVIKA
jgi:hypothetical protein